MKLSTTSLIRKQCNRLEKNQSNSESEETKKKYFSFYPEKKKESKKKKSRNTKTNMEAKLIGEVFSH